MKASPPSQPLLASTLLRMDPDLLQVLTG